MKIQKRLWLGILMVFGMAVLMTGCKKQVEQVTTTEYSPYDQAEEITAVLQEMDLEQGTMSFVSVADGRTYYLLYNQGVDLRNKYDEVMTTGKMYPGQIYDVVYNPITGKMLTAKINKEAWMVNNITQLKYDRLKTTATILNQEYRYDSNLVVASGGKLLAIHEISNQDVLTAWGYGGKLCSLVVEQGHGYIVLEDYDTYIGGMIEIGYDVIVPVTESMILTVREGDYKLKITKGRHSGYKYIHVMRDQEQTISLKELQIAPDPVGSIFFDVTPANAYVYVDGELIDASEPVELTYGNHRLRVMADGYGTRTEIFKVDAAYKIYTIDMTKESGTGSSTAEPYGGTSGTTAYPGSAGTAATTAAGSTAASTTAAGTTAAGTTAVPTTSSSNTRASTASGSTASTSTSGTTATTTTEAPTTAVKQTAKLYIQSPVGADCYIDGVLVGKIPCSVDKVPGTHVITLRKSGYGTKGYTIQCLDDGKDEEYNFPSLTTDTYRLWGRLGRMGWCR